MYLKSAPSEPRTSLIFTRYWPSAGAMNSSFESLPSSRWDSSSLSKYSEKTGRPLGIKVVPGG